MVFPADSGSELAREVLVASDPIALAEAAAERFAALAEAWLVDPAAACLLRPSTLKGHFA